MLCKSKICHCSSLSSKLAPTMLNFESGLQALGFDRGGSGDAYSGSNWIVYVFIIIS